MFHPARLTRIGLVYYGTLIVAFVVGVVIGGGIGATIAAIAAGAFALTILGAGGIGVAARDSLDRRGRRFGRPLDDDEERELRE
jgi:pilus assembly protein TadC